MPVFFNCSGTAALVATPASAALVAFAALGGCGPAEGTSGPGVPELPGITTVNLTDASSSSGEGSTSGDSTSTSTSTFTSTSTSSSGGSEDSAVTEGEGTTLLYDLGPDTGDVDDPLPAGCSAKKIDFLFVLSRGLLIKDFEAPTLASFPKFIATIENKFADFDYHIMVIDSDGRWGSELCNTQCDQTGVCDSLPAYPCALRHLVTPCDETRGAGRVFNAGFYSANKPCDIPEGRRYIAKGDPNLKDLFACIAQIGTGGYALMGESVTAAMKPSINAPDGCNAGFLRDDALLMITFVGGYDEDSKDDPGTWSANILKAKGGDPRSVVMLSILHQECDSGDRICQLLKKYPYHALGDIYEPDYGEAFDEAVDLVDLACSAQIPG